MKMGYGNGPRKGHRIASVAAGRQSRLVVHFLVILHKRDWAYSGVKKTSCWANGSKNEEFGSSYLIILALRAGEEVAKMR